MQKGKRAGNLFVAPPPGWGGGVPGGLVCGLSQGSQQMGFLTYSPILPEDEGESSFQNIVFLQFYVQTMDEIQKHYFTLYNAPASENFNFRPLQSSPKYTSACHTWSFCISFDTVESLELGSCALSLHNVINIRTSCHAVYD
jgi:hypothetical protein